MKNEIKNTRLFSSRKELFGTILFSIVLGFLLVGIRAWGWGWTLPTTILLAIAAIILTWIWLYYEKSPEQKRKERE